jgi:transposase
MLSREARTKVSLSEEQRDELLGWLRRTNIAAGLAKRARAMLLLAEGTSVSQTARLVDLQRRHLYKWIERFRKQGIAGLPDGKRTGRPPVFSPRSCDASGQDCLRTAG